MRNGTFLRGSVLLVATGLITVLAGWTGRARADDEATPPDAGVVVRRMGSLNDQLENANGELAVVKLQLDRANTIVASSTKYQIPADLAAAIYDIALSEGIDPSLGYQLVKIESNFKANARSPMNAIGYTQLQLPTARFYQPGITERALLERDTNLRIGFRFLSDLLAKFDNNTHLALLAYNRGPARVEQILASGGDPMNGYSEAVLKGYRPLVTTP
jgi:soluble lytic murein transglycosylase-like protein